MALLSGPPFSNRIDFVYFDFWHYDGRTSGPRGLMGGPISCSGTATIRMLSKTVELKSMAQELRGAHGHGK